MCLMPAPEPKNTGPTEPRIPAHSASLHTQFFLSYFSVPVPCFSSSQPFPICLPSSKPQRGFHSPGDPTREPPCLLPSLLSWPGLQPPRRPSQFLAYHPDLLGLQAFAPTPPVPGMPSSYLAFKLVLKPRCPHSHILSPS